MLYQNEEIYYCLDAVDNIRNTQKFEIYMKICIHYLLQISMYKNKIKSNLNVGIFILRAGILVL